MKVLSLLLAGVLGEQEQNKDPSYVPDGKARGSERGQYPSQQTPQFNAPSRGACTTSESNGIVTAESAHYYANNELCHIELKCASDEFAFIKWDKIDIELHDNCFYDYVMAAWVDVNESSPTIEWFCGTDGNNKMNYPEKYEWRHTNSRHIVLDFYTDYSVTRWGWSAQLQCIKEDEIDICSFQPDQKCHADANCIVDPNDSAAYSCECRTFYEGDGVESCEFHLGNKFIIDTYRVTSKIADRYVQNELAVVVTNQNTQDGEFYTFNVYLDEDEFINGLVMRVGDDGPVTRGNVHKEQEAQEIFDQAVSNGQGAALTEETDEVISDSSFSTTVFVPPGETLYIWLNYDMQLERRKANYKYRTHLLPTDPVEKLQVIVDIDESRPLKGPQTYVWFESDDKHSSTNFTRNEISEGHVVFSYEKRNIGENEFDDQLRVEYDVVRPTADCGDLIMRDGFFVHFISDDNTDPLPKNVVLTVDTSGSMSWQNRMGKARDAMLVFLDELNENDTFWLQEFNSQLSVFRTETLKATPGNVAEAKNWVRGLNAGGGTNLGEATFTSVDRPLDLERANIAFIISDGEPTSGAYTDWDDIQAITLTKNVRADGAGQKWAVFNIGVGDGAPITEITKLSVQNMGLARQLFDNEDVVAELTGFFDEYASPLIWNQQFQYSGVEEFDCSSKHLFANQEMTCIGKLEDACSDNTLEEPGYGQLMAPGILGTSTARGGARRCRPLNKDSCAEGSNVVPFIPEDEKDLMDNPFPQKEEVDLKKVFAYQFMRRRIELWHATRSQELRDQIQQEVEDLAVENDFVTIFTSLVVVQGQTRKRRSFEKRQQIASLFKEYHNQVARLNEVEALRVRRDTEVQSGFNKLTIMVFIAMAFAVLPMRRIRRRLC